MADIGNYVVPFLLITFLITGLCRGVKIYDCFIEGAREGIETAVKILPSILGLIVAVSMLKASGMLDLISYGLSGAAAAVGMPKEVLPLALLKPISGSGGIALLEGIFKEFGPDSTAGRVASVIAGATETTFYTVAVYYGAVGIKNTRHTVFASVVADFMGIVMSGVAVRIFF